MRFCRANQFPVNRQNYIKNMHYFEYKLNDFYCENVRVSDLAKKVGTPFYLYSARTIVEHFMKIKEALKKIDPLICYSVKANSNISILKLLVKQGAGLDIVSGGELYRAEMAQCPAKKIVYASVGKTAEEISAAIKKGILMFNVESLPELAQIDRVARGLRKNVNVALRINPDVEADTHKYITTGKKKTKFGFDIFTARKVIFGKLGKYPNLRVNGIHIHIGSQIIKSGPFMEAIRRMLKLINDIKRHGYPMEYLDIGGGMGIIYDRENPQTAADYAKAVLPLLQQSGLKIILEPGRFIVGNAGILVTKVIYLKESYSKRFIIVDAAMNDLIRPALYDAYHNIVPLRRTRFSGKIKPADVVGPVCESGDFLGKNRSIYADSGDYLAVMSAGAYGFSMSSNYNSRPRAAEILVSDKKARWIRQRETYSDLVRHEKHKGVFL